MERRSGERPVGDRGSRRGPRRLLGENAGRRAAQRRHQPFAHGDHQNDAEAWQQGRIGQ
jgi:hypothetical protein